MTLLARILVIAFQLFAGVGCVGRFSEDFEVFFPDVAAARADYAFIDDTVPEVTPESAINIRVFYHLDVPNVWGCFDIGDGMHELRFKLGARGARRVFEVLLEGPPIAFWSRSWWPKSMTAGNVEAYHYVERRRSVTVGIDEGEGRSCYFSSEVY